MVTGPTRIGLIGCGQMGRLHGAAYRRAGAQVVAVVDLNAEAGNALGAEYGCKVYTDVAQMLSSERLDAVSVATPPGMHLEHAVAAARAGVAVLCEKPLAQSADSAATLVEAVARTGVVMMVGLFHRFHEPCVRLKEMVEAGRFGRPLVVRSHFTIPASQGPVRPWVSNPAIAGGGALVNTASHSMDLVSWLTGTTMTSIQALTTKRGQGPSLEDTGIVTLQADTGDLGLVEAYEGVAFRRYELWLQGPNGEAEIGWDPPSLRIRTAEAPQWQEIPLRATAALDRIDNAITYFLDCVRTGNHPDRATAADGLRSIKLVEAAYESAKSASRISL